MDGETFKQLETLIETLTHSGLNSLDEEIFGRVISGQRTPCYDLIKKQLNKGNSQIRLAAFQICKELFKRSAAFRENVVRDLHSVFELIIETDGSKKLPPPRSAADILKQSAIFTLKSWTEEYGEAYKKLKIAYDYFEKCKKIKFESFEVGNSAEQLLENEHQRHLRVVNEDKIKTVLNEFSSIKSEIEVTMTSLSNCLCLLLPPPEEFFVPDHILQKIEPMPVQTNQSINTDSDVKNENYLDEDKIEESDTYLLPSNNLREFGIPLNYSLSVELNLSNQFKITKTEENCAIIENAKDNVRLLTSRYLPMVKKWLNIYCKCSSSGSNEMKEIIDLKEKLEQLLKKCNSLCVTEDDSSSSADEFEEVKEDHEETVSFPEYYSFDCLKNVAVVAPSTSKPPSKEPVPSTSNCNLKETKASAPPPETSDRKKKLLAIAPKLPFDNDLYHWDDENLSAPILLSTRIDVDKFWGSAGADDLHEIRHPDGVAALRTRVIEFSGTFEPVKWACRAPFPNGKLCPRKDRFKCPFHGKIVPRDETGNIQIKGEQKSVNKTTEESPSTVPDWQDPELLRDLKACTGVDLKMPEKRGKRKMKLENKNLTHKKMKTSRASLKLMQSKQLPGLVDVVKKQNNVYTRLKKKIFNRASTRRVSAVLDKLDRKKFRDKFADQFNYT